QQRGLSAARRADERRHLLGVERDVDRLERAVIAVEEIEVAHRDLRLRGIDGARCVADDRDWSRAVGRGTLYVGHGHDAFPDAASERAMMLRASTDKVMMSAPVQASFCHSS